MVIQKNWQTLIKPKQLSVESGDDPKRVATVVADADLLDTQDLGARAAHNLDGLLVELARLERM